MTMQNTVGRYDIAAQEDRSAPRMRIMIPAQMRASGARSFQTVVNDLSLSGFSATAVNRMHPGSICWLTLPGLESLQAEVVWWENGMAGCAFANLLSPIVHDNIVSRFKDQGSFKP
ncbi:PilZ domain-containing protein [Erythrobacter alti]|uniref:PilZ domain-containing protein n=1 Tax=Erythrobacter alti TaxID=1896145 RepID=UPI0030F3B1D1